MCNIRDLGINFYGEKGAGGDSTFWVFITDIYKQLP